MDEGLDSEVLPIPYHMQPMPTPRCTRPGLRLAASAAARAFANGGRKRLQALCQPGAGHQALARRRRHRRPVWR